MGENSRSESQEITAIEAAIGMGYRLIDTAEMYAEGGAEEVVGAAITGQRDSMRLRKLIGKRSCECWAAARHFPRPTASARSW